MAQLVPSLPERWAARQTNAQYAAIAWLRWRMWVNSFRRKGGKTEFFGQILTVLVAIILLIGPTTGAGLAAWYFASQGELQRLALLLWAIFGLSQLLNINLGQPGTTFKPTELIRFPLTLPSYVSVRLFFGLLAPANVMVLVTSFAIAAGIAAGQPSLWLYALLAMLLFALTNVLFTRMVFAWVDRWMSTRRAREVFTAVIFVTSLGFQYVNAQFNPAYSHHRHINNKRVTAAEHLYHKAEPLIAVLPPGLTVRSLLSAQAHHPFAVVGQMAGTVSFGLLFLGAFAWRTRTEFLGENLSDAANVVAAKHLVRRATRAPAPDAPALAVRKRAGFGIPPTVLTVFGKEFLYLRRNTGLFYGLIAPMVMVFLFAGRLAARTTNEWLFPSALAYALMGIAPLAYNSFGLEGTGTQFYFLAPVQLRHVLLGKNLMTFLLSAVEITCVLLILSYVASPPPLQMILIGLCWALGTTLLNVSVGNLRSISAPKKIDLNRTAGKQASPLSALMSIGILLLAAGFAAGLLLLGHLLAMSRFIPAIIAAYAAVGVAVYVANLRAVNRFALNHRDELFEELCKQ